MTTIILNGARVKAVNKTPHALNIYDLEGTDVLGNGSGLRDHSHRVGQ